MNNDDTPFKATIRDPNKLLNDMAFACGYCQERWWDWNPAIVGPNSEEPCNNDWSNLND